MIDSLYSPDFWRAFIRQLIPFNEEHEECMFADLAHRSGIPVDRLRRRMDGYLKAFMAERRREVHEVGDTLH